MIYNLFHYRFLNHLMWKQNFIQRFVNLFFNTFILSHIKSHYSIELRYSGWYTMRAYQEIKLKWFLTAFYLEEGGHDGF